MELLNIMIGTYGLQLALVMLLVVILVEVIFISKKLFQQFIKLNVIIAVTISNSSSTIFGFLTLGIFWRALIDWSIETFTLDIDHTSVYFKIAFFLIAWILTILIEIPINTIILKSKKIRSRIWINTIYANIISYLLLILVTKGI
ncbi:hypothetical protein GCQ56_19100 [Marinifilum sp. N1E240]|uniref:hypothetical protein n=1 Tax=Marinifilum sp. N1E240 TaxID=2608082 RepID=UPI00128C3B0D|nr:hypothetical protein [Marinifilum sp. N1E240]MPQ49112.1 hypothetical protein [Marinifilum sp. N1E240]